MTNNVVHLIGRLGADPEPNQTRNNTPVTNLSIATNRSWQDDRGERQEDTTWHDVTVWGGTAEACCKYLSKGRRVAVTGRIEKQEYTDRDGIDRTKRVIIAQSVQFLGGEDGGGRGRGQKKTKPSKNNPARNNGGRNRRNQGGGRQSRNSRGGGGGGGGGRRQQSGGGRRQQNQQDNFDDDFSDDDIPF